MTLTATDQIAQVSIQNNVLHMGTVAAGDRLSYNEHPHRMIEGPSSGDSSQTSLWYTLSHSNQIGELPLATTNHQARDAKTWPPDSDRQYAIECPIGIAQGPNSPTNHITYWVGEIGSGQLGKLTPDDSTATRYQSYDFATDVWPQEPERAGDWVWVSIRNRSWFRRINSVTDTPDPTHITTSGVSEPHALIMAPADGNLYATEVAGHSIDQILGPAGTSPSVSRCVIGGTSANMSDVVTTPLQSGSFYVYFTNSSGQKMGRIRVTPANNSFTTDCGTRMQWPLSDASYPKGLSLGPPGDPRIYFTLARKDGIGGIGWFDPATTERTECVLVDGRTCGTPTVVLPDGVGDLVYGLDALQPPIQDGPVGCGPVSHHITAKLQGTVPDPDAETELLPLTGSLDVTISAGCESADSGMGTVTAVTVSDPNLSFEFTQGGDYVRAASQASASADGRCTVRTLQYFCRLSFAATWMPITDPLDPTVITGAELPQGTFRVTAT